MSSGASYDPVASLYDSYWGQRFFEFAREAFHDHLGAKLPPGGAVLDLCCGTGLLLAHAEGLGFDVSGVDESANMLAVARRNAPRAHLQQADMAGFTLNQQFDAVVWFYNSLNHARSVEHMRATVVNIAQHLKPGGHLLFDYVLPKAFEDVWEWSEQIDGWMFRYTYDGSSGQATCLINQSGAIRQMSFQARQIHEAVSDAGMTIVYEEPMTGAPPLGARQLVLAHR
jgi:SAM-dependent methyltransferase